MVLPVAAAHAASAAASGGAAALGLGQGRASLDQTQELFLLQMRQTKRLWTADFAEASVRHGEACAQSARQHAEAMAAATAAHHQSERLTNQSVRLARDQDSRAYEMAWRAEVRESLRDELANQYNRFNIVMLCDTVCLSCVFSLVTDGTLPEGTAPAMVSAYVLFTGISITLFSVSLWCAVIVVRRLHEHTAAILERKLFAQSEDLQKVWQRQLRDNLPTGPNEIYLVHRAYEKWVAQYLTPLGNPSVHMMAYGVVMMFVSAGLLTHNRYLVEYGELLPVPVFWSTVFVTSATVLTLKFAEDRAERRKEGVYDGAWRDHEATETGPFAKIARASDDLHDDDAVALGDARRARSLRDLERRERAAWPRTEALRRRAGTLGRDESRPRAEVRRSVLELLTTADEELDALPEELTSRLNKMLHRVDEADGRTAEAVAGDDAQGESERGGGWIPGSPKAVSGGKGSLSSLLLRPAMAQKPIDAQRAPVTLGALRRKLGEWSLTTLLRIRNLSDEPLRRHSGAQLKDGKYCKNLDVNDSRTSTTACHHLYPGSEIPPRSEIVVAARNGGGWIPTSSIDGEIVYTNRDETWLFRVSFVNQLVRQIRQVRISATRVDADGDGKDNEHHHRDDDQFWTIAKEELDVKANSEVLVTIDVLEGERGKRAATHHRASRRVIKSGRLWRRRRSLRPGPRWHLRHVELTPVELLWAESPDADDAVRKRVALTNVAHVVARGVDEDRRNVFEVHTHDVVEGGAVHKFSAKTAKDRDDWVTSVAEAAGVSVNGSSNGSPYGRTVSRDASAQSVVEGGFECVDHNGRMSVMMSNEYG